MELKPIETQYKGYRFRSRLEARWAVFFDALKQDWQYEPEGFVFDDGTKYLPDFYFPKFFGMGPAYVEIKPEIPSPDSMDAIKVANLNKYLGHGKIAFMLVGQPDPLELLYFVVITHDGLKEGLTLSFLGYIDYPKHEQYCLIALDERLKKFIISCPEGNWSIDKDENVLVLCEHKKIINALKKARAARFEFGEKG